MKLRFNSSRYPTKPADIAKKFDPQTHNHVVFIRKNKFYEVQLEQDRVQLSTAELEVYVLPLYRCASNEILNTYGASIVKSRK
jgi:carnitine O-acetyltransferase